jgi:hypothetical protein
MCLCVFVVAVPALYAQTAGAPADATAVWNALQSPAMDPTKSATTENVEIVRDRIHITLKSGTIQFAQPANGVVFGAVFRGEGRLRAEPPNPIEAQQLRLFTKQDKLDMTFTEATFSFTDGFLDEVGKQVKWTGGGAGDDLYAKRQQERENLGAAQLPRLFKSVLSGDHKRISYFLADLHTKEKDWVEVFDDAMEQEEISVGRWVQITPVRIFDTWMSFPANGRDPRQAYADPGARLDYLVPGYQIDAAVTAGAELSATARASVQPRFSGERVLLFDLDSNLRVDSVKDAQGHALEFYQAQEKKDRYQSYGDYIVVVLASPTETGAAQKLEFHYAGKRAIRKVGEGNYFCESTGWYPAMARSRTGTGDFAFRSNFEMTFHSPKKFSLVATGHKVSEATDNNAIVTSWKSDIPLAAAGFAYGDYKLYAEKVGDIDIQVYANRQPDDLLVAIQRVFDNPLDDLWNGSISPGSPRSVRTAAIGNLSAAALAKTVGVETGNALRVFQAFYGPYPYKQLAVTNIIGSYGQGWPGLLYLGWFTFLDPTQLNALGVRQQVEYTDAFRAHESSHQWWGHRVGWKSYHDQWLSEGFAEFSGILYVQYRQSWKEALVRLRKEKEHLEVGDRYSHKIDSLGPIWLGERIGSSETDGSSYQNLIYSKGAYVLYMLRMMLYDSRNPDPDHLFKDLMQDYCKSFDNKPASTEDFKAIVEKHMTRAMDLDGNHKMGWFFSQYVYGTGIPTYGFSYVTEPAPDGKIKFSGQLARSGVPDTWKDIVAVYAHQGQKVTRLGFITASQAVTPFDVVVPASFDRFSINDNEDLLADVKQ